MPKTKTNKKTDASKPRVSKPRWRGKDGQMLSYYLNLSEDEHAALSRLEKVSGYSRAAVLRSLIMEADAWAKSAGKAVMRDWMMDVASFERASGPRARAA